MTDSEAAVFVADYLQRKGFSTTLAAFQTEARPPPRPAGLRPLESILSEFLLLKHRYLEDSVKGHALGSQDGVEAGLEHSPRGFGWSHGQDPFDEFDGGAQHTREAGFDAEYSGSFAFPLDIDALVNSNLPVHLAQYINEHRGAEPGQGLPSGKSSTQALPGEEGVAFPESFSNFMSHGDTESPSPGTGGLEAVMERHSSDAAAPSPQQATPPPPSRRRPGKSKPPQKRIVPYHVSAATDATAAFPPPSTLLERSLPPPNFHSPKRQRIAAASSPWRQHRNGAAAPPPTKPQAAAAFSHSSTEAPQQPAPPPLSSSSVSPPAVPPSILSDAAIDEFLKQLHQA